jgi:hypothetical protein
LAREQELGARYNRLTRQIIAFRLTHVVLAIVIGVIYMSHLKLDHLVYWRGFGFKTILLVALPVWPYVGSALFSWSLATRNRVRPWIFFSHWWRVPLAWELSTVGCGAMNWKRFTKLESRLRSFFYTYLQDRGRLTTSPRMSSGSSQAIMLITARELRRIGLDVTGSVDCPTAGFANQIGPQRFLTILATATYRRICRRTNVAWVHSRM